MKRPWHKEKPELLERMKEAVLKEYPTLLFYPEDECVFVRGDFPIADEGKVLDQFSIEIELPRYDPNDLPVLREIGGRIPRTQDNHINVPSGEVCLFVPDERWRIYPRGSTLLDFLNGPLRNYFIGYSLFELGEPWPFGQRSHGAEGIFEYYSELLGTDDRRVVIRYLECMSKPTLKGHWECPCGSGKRIRNCHQTTLNDLRLKIPPLGAKYSLEQFDVEAGLEDLNDLL
jgi:hypothetical protein